MLSAGAFPNIRLVYIAYVMYGIYVDRGQTRNGVSVRIVTTGSEMRKIYRFCYFTYLHTFTHIQYIYNIFHDYWLYRYACDALYLVDWCSSKQVGNPAGNFWESAHINVPMFYTWKSELRPKSVQFFSLKYVERKILWLDRCSIHYLLPRGLIDGRKSQLADGIGSGQKSPSV